MPARKDQNQHERKGVPSELSDASRGIRLQKAIAEAGLASRRTCEQLIEEGRVRVNGKLVTALPAWVDPEHDKITVDGRPVPMPRGGSLGGRKVYILLNKPRNVITTVHDPEGRRTVMDLIDMDGAPRLFPVGRLDADSTGLILLTNDGDLAQRLTHPSFGVMKEYHVAIRGRLDEQDIAILRKGLFLTDQRENRYGKKMPAKRARVSSVKLLGYGRGSAGDRTRVSVKLQEGQNREIRRMMARIGFNVRRLQRVAIGPLKIKGLGVGQWRLLTKAEVDRLYRTGAPAPATGRVGGTGFKGRRPSAGPRRSSPARNGPPRGRPKRRRP